MYKDEDYIKAARAFHQEGDLEFDDKPVVSRGDDPGAYVQCWKWIPDAAVAEIASPRYCWVITEDYLDNVAQGTYGPSGNTVVDRSRALWGTPFRLLDDDRKVYFEGKISPSDGSENDFAPLDQWGEAFGCTTIQYRDNDGLWADL